MKLTNYSPNLMNYLAANPNLTYDEIGKVLLIDSMYDEIPDDIDKFRRLYSHFDPNVLDQNEGGIIFLDIANSDEPSSVLKHRLNSYFNVKSHFIDNYKSYQENSLRLKKAMHFSSLLIDDFLNVANFPYEIIESLRESDMVRTCDDFYDLLRLYKESKNRRIKYEILRKLGLIVLIKRIRRTYIYEEFDYALENVKRLFRKGLSLTEKKQRTYYIWLDSNNELRYMQNKKQATKHYENSLKQRKRLGLGLYPLQKFNCYPGKTRFGNFVFHTEFRNKIRKNGDLSYTSFVEKMLRKNLSFPTMVRDVIGVRIIVESEEEIPQLVRDLESFLGGSSTRKREKNGLDRFGKRKLNKYSSEDYYVWKAVYDIALPHPSISFINKLLSQCHDDGKIRDILKEEKLKLEETPKDFVVEVQIQELSSYLLSIVHGSPSTHEALKTKQIRCNSFYKMFPKEIYEQEMFKLKKTLLLR
ncbi:MAG: hypothetical protein ACOCZ6_00530 [Nanoarchaeota archaeon]